MSESRDWGPYRSTEACTRADLVPLLDESAWRSGVASPRRPVRRHISRGPVPRSQTSASPPHSGTLSQLPTRGACRGQANSRPRPSGLPLHTPESPSLRRASRCRAPGSFMHAPSAGSTPASRSTDPGAHALCSMRPRDRCVASFWPLHDLPARRTRGASRGCLRVRAGRWTRDRAAWVHRYSI